jgi:hypothetical protein
MFYQHVLIGLLQALAWGVYALVALVYLQPLPVVGALLTSVWFAVQAWVYQHEGMRMLCNHWPTNYITSGTYWRRLLIWATANLAYAFFLQVGWRFFTRTRSLLRPSHFLRVVSRGGPEGRTTHLVIRLPKRQAAILISSHALALCISVV